MKKACVLFLIISILTIPLLTGCEGPEKVQSQTVKTETEQIIAGYPENQPDRQTDDKLQANHHQPASNDTKSSQQPDEKTASGSSDKAGPNVTVENPTHDFGVVGPGTKNKTEFEFKNTGTESLKIQTIHSTCSCSVPEIKKKTYEPGETGSFSLTYTATEHEGTDTKHLYIISNDPDTPRYQVTIKAKIELDVEYGPQRINLSLKEQNAGMPPLTIRSKDNTEFAIKSLSTIRDVITADIDPQKKATEFTLQPKVDLEKLKDNLTGSITVTLDHPTAKRLRFYFTTQPLFEVTPARIIFQNAQPGETLTRQLLIKSNYGDDLAVDSVTARDGLLSVVTQEELGNRAQLKIAFTAPENKKGRFFSDVLTVKLTSGQELQINASGWLKQ